MLYSLTLTWSSRSNISNVNISKTVRASAKVQSVTFVDFSICHRMASLRILYSLTLSWWHAKLNVQIYVPNSSSVCARCSLLQAPLSMREPVVKDENKQAIVAISAIAYDNGIVLRFSNALSQ